MSEGFTKRGIANWEHYRHIESDQDMSHSEKEKHMEAWWDADMSDIATEKLTKDHFLSMTKNRYGFGEVNFANFYVYYRNIF